MTVHKAMLPALGLVAGFCLFVTGGVALMVWRGEATLAVVLMIVSLALVAGSASRLLNVPADHPMRRIKYHLAFAAAGLGAFFIAALVITLGKEVPSPINLVVAWIAVAAMVLLTVGMWILFLHFVGLILSVGHMLSLRGRLTLYFLVFGVPILAALVFCVGAPLPERIVLATIALWLVAVLTAYDFHRHPDVEEQSQYDPLARRVAKLLRRNRQ